MTSIRFMIVLNTVQFNLGFTISPKDGKLVKVLKKVQEQVVDGDIIAILEVTDTQEDMDVLIAEATNLITTQFKNNIWL